VGLWTYRAIPLAITDGDTCRLLVDHGAYIRSQMDVRLADVYAPELRDPGGYETREYVLDWMAELPSVNWPLLIRTDPNTTPEPEERRSFVRYIATVWDIGEIRCLNVDLRGFLAEHPEWGP